jgi:ubiquinone/menaquinone biosynthesis C-methylase UbiE
MSVPHSPTELQRRYYAETAVQYDDMHVEPEHELALLLLGAFIERCGISSVLDVGAGTGRAMVWLKRRFPDLVVKGVEPVESLRCQAYAKGVSPNDLIAGDAYALPFEDDSFDLVVEFAVLHHVSSPNRVVIEMSRVASRMVCISDCNFLGQGSRGLRVLKYLIYLLGLWPAANWIKTAGKGYTFSEGDGVAYSYSVYQSLKVLRKRWKDIRIVRTSNACNRPYATILSAGHVILIGTNRNDGSTT